MKYQYHETRVKEEQVMHEKKWMVLIAAALIVTAFCAVHLGKHLQSVAVEKQRQQTMEKSAEQRILRRQCRAKWPELGSHYKICLRNIK